MNDQAFFISRESESRIKRYRAAMKRLKDIAEAARRKIAEGGLTERQRIEQINILNDIAGAELTLRF